MKIISQHSPQKTQIIIDAGTGPKTGSSIELITGAAVIDLLCSPEFQKSMDILYESCIWATVFQSRSFITAWYQVYRNKHTPILVKAEVNGQLTGVLPLALLDTKPSDRKVAGNGKRITGVGHYDAEYQTWLAMPGFGELFIKEALAELMKQFKGHPITFRYLPPGTPLGWVKDDKKWRSYSILQSHSRPLINLNEPDHAKLLQSKQFRNKLNRLKRLGEVQLETVTDPEIFKYNLNELGVLYDFRFCALFNKHHFRDDPSKTELLIELFALHLLHVTILKVNGKTFAAVVATAAKDWVYMSGFSCHSPFKARAYSPGLLHFSFLAKKLKDEQKEYFDLTPGYDSYKEKLANQHDEVHELLINSNMIYRLKKRVRKWMHVRLLAAGMRPMTVEVNLKKILYKLRHKSITAELKKLAKRLQKKPAPKRYEIAAYTLKSGVKIAVNKNNLNDLLQFKTDKKAGITRWEFIADAMYRLEVGQHCFTLVENDRLLSCAWLSYPDAGSAAGKDNRGTDSDIKMEHLYCHSTAKVHVQPFLYSIINAAIADRCGNYFLTSEPLFCQALEAMGLQPE
jgi:hypothetical protein